MPAEIYLPVSISVFETIRKDGFLYVDKTAYVHKLTQRVGFYFLARPRRFGKSMLLDTIAMFFEGRRDLFNGLEIDRLNPGQWDRCPVIRLNLSGNTYNEPTALTRHLHGQLDDIADKYGVDRCAQEGPERRFFKIIQLIEAKNSRKVAVLIDEYDVPLTDNIDRPELHELFREQLHGFYSVLKSAESCIQFCMITGVTRYGKVSVFSGLNNLNDITFLDDYAGICGITESELHRYYAEAVGQFAQANGLTSDEVFQMLKRHYDGYHFSKSMLDVYNPFSINHALENREIKDYWCASGAPTVFLKQLMKVDYDLDDLNGKKVTEPELGNLSMFTDDPVPLFYQTGYLTLKGYDPRRQKFTLGYPNREVETGILGNVLNVYAPKIGSPASIAGDMADAFLDGKPEEFIKTLKAFLAGIPVDLKTHAANYENYYHTVFYCLTKLIGLDTEAEYGVAAGFIDMLVKTDKYIYIIELKVNGTAADAMAQIAARGYVDAFAADPRQKVWIGIGFSKQTGTVDSHQIEFIH